MSATTTQEKIEQSVPARKQIFLDQSYFKGFLERVAEAAGQSLVNDEDIPLIWEALKPLGEGLPRSCVKGAIFRD